MQLPKNAREHLQGRSEQNGVRALFIQKGERLQARDFKRLAAADVHAREFVVSPHHIRLRFGEFRAIPFVCISGKLGSLAADYPGDFVFARLTTLRAGEVMRTRFGALVEKIAFFHAKTPVNRGSAIQAQRQNACEEAGLFAQANPSIVIPAADSSSLSEGEDRGTLMNPLHPP